MIRLCPDCQARLFDDWAKTIVEGDTKFWPFCIAPDSEEQIEVDEGAFIAGMAERGWYYLDWIGLWDDEEPDTEDQGT